MLLCEVDCSQSRKGVFTAISKCDISEEDEREEGVYYIFVYDIIVDEDTAEVIRLCDYLGEGFIARSY